jgi:hypothetical protein
MTENKGIDSEESEWDNSEESDVLNEGEFQYFRGIRRISGKLKSKLDAIDWHYEVREKKLGI